MALSRVFDDMANNSGKLLRQSLHRPGKIVGNPSLSGNGNEGSASIKSLNVKYTRGRCDGRAGDTRRAFRTMSHWHDVSL